MSAPEVVETQRAGGSLAALRHRDFRIYWFGQFVSVTGTQMQIAAINWHIYLLTRSSLALGGVGLVRVVPIILCSLAGGVVADVFDRKRLMIITQSVMMISAAVLAYMTASGLRTIWPIYGLTALASAALAFDSPARQSLLPMLVPEHDFANAASLGLAQFQASTVIGPALAGLLLEAHGPALIYTVNAVSFLAVIVALFMIQASGLSGPRTEQAPSLSWSSLTEGLRFVWRTPIIVQTMTLDFIATFFASATALLPIFAGTILKVGARGYGLLQASPAMGSVLAAIVMARLGNIRRQGLTVVAAVAAYGAATLGFGLSRVFWVSVAMLAMVGASDTVSTVLRMTIRQLVTPNHLRGRMTSVNMIFFMGGPQLGEMEAGVVARFVGAPLSVISGGIGCLVAVAIAAVNAKNLLAYDQSSNKVAVNNINGSTSESSSKDGRTGPIRRTDHAEVADPGDSLSPNRRA
jgi:MFS family permease